jgi:CRISPR-associated protein Cmr3
MTIEYRFLEPIDTLILRGNKLFGEAGSFGESLIPPWPSVAAGAIRSRMLVDGGIDLGQFARGEINHPQLGTPIAPGSFRLSHFQLAQLDTSGSVNPIYPLPADLQVSQQDPSATPHLHQLQPTMLHPAVASSAPLPLLPVLAQTGDRAKPIGGYLLRFSGWQRYLRGELPLSDDLVTSSKLWQIESQIGIGLSSETRSVNSGQLFSTQTISFCSGVGFLVGVAGAVPPADGLLRFGGDGRAVQVATVAPPTAACDFAAIIRQRRCRLVLTTPGLFADGWRPTGVATDNRFDLHGVRGRLVSAAVARSETLSGWDLAQWQPKPAQRIAPGGSVWWLDEVEATAEALQQLCQHGLWPEGTANHGRQAEGFNQIQLAEWR